MENSNPSSWKNNEKYYGVGSFIWELLKVFVLAFVIIVPIRVFLFQPFFVQGASMEPNFENNEYLIINELGYKKTEIGLGGQSWVTVVPFKNIERGEVIVFRYPKNPSQFFIKRVIGLPGEKVEVANGQIKIYNIQSPNGFVLSEKDYLSSTLKTSGALTIDLKEDEYFVLGDNRSASSDSRSWGPVPASDIIGRVWLRAWPLNRLAWF